MYLWWSLCTLYSLACQVRVTVVASGLCCWIHVNRIRLSSVFLLDSFCLAWKDVPLVEFMYPVFARTPGGSYCRCFKPLLLSSCDFFQPLITFLCLFILPCLFVYSIFFFICILSNFSSLKALILLVHAGLFWCLHKPPRYFYFGACWVILVSPQTTKILLVHAGLF